MKVVLLLCILLVLVLLVYVQSVGVGVLICVGWVVMEVGELVCVCQFFVQGFEQVVGYLVDVYVVVIGLGCVVLWLGYVVEVE